MERLLNYKELIGASGVKKGMSIDIVLDMFNLKKQCMILGCNFNADDFVEELKDVVGSSGNILVRAFSWDFCHGKSFDIRETASQSGALGNIVKNRKDFKRSRHPIYNWFIYGRDADYLCSIDVKEAFGKGSIFEWEENNDNAYQINIGSPQSNGLTVFHYMEKKMNVPYRYEKDFTEYYIDFNGFRTQRTYSMYVRDLAYEIDTKDAVYDDELQRKHIKVNNSYSGIEINSYKLKELCAVYEADFSRHKVPTGVTLTPVEQGENNG